MTNPLASQQPAPIPEDLILAHRWWKKDLDAGKTYTVPTSAGVELIERIARMEAALRALRTYMWAEGYADQTPVMRQADAALGTPGREKP